MKINQEKMNALYGEDNRRAFTEGDVITLIKKRMEYLMLHNKNYTQTQWVYLQDIEDMLAAIED